jgi:hypothetical protein
MFRQPYDKLLFCEIHQIMHAFLAERITVFVFNNLILYFQNESLLITSSECQFSL